MKRKKGLVLVAALLLVITATMTACTTTPATETGVITVRVVATRDFGRELMFDETLEVPAGTAAMAALMKAAKIETEYGGGFVEAINGVRSGFSGSQPAKMDWFIYINGLQSNTGALDYKLHDGDVQHWDFHEWSFHQFTPAIVGGFPEPFLHGYGGVIYPTIIVYQEGWAEDARRLADKLSRLGIENVATRGINELKENEKESGNLVLLGTPDFTLIAELNQVWKRLGFYAHFQDSVLEVFDAEGKPEAEYRDGAGIIQATRSPWNPKGIGVCENTAWIVSGTDAAGVRAAVDTLVSRDTDLRYASAVVIVSGEVIRVPR